MSRPTAATLVTAALLILLPMLAILQYRWVEQVRDADRERMQTHVHNAAMQFHEALDGEIVRAVINLQVGVATARDGFSDRYNDRYDGWLTTAAHPQIVASVLLIDAEDGRLQLRSWNATTHTFDAAEWPAVLLPLRTELEQELVSVRAGQPFQRRLPLAVDDSIVITPMRPPPPDPAQTATPQTPLFGFTVLQLDLPYIQTQLLPELAQRYFLMGSGDGYRVSVLSSADPTDVIYRSDPDAPIDEAVADTSEPLFGLRGDLFFAAGRGGDPRRQNARVRGRNGDDGPGGRPRPFDRDFGRWRLLARHESGSLDAAVTKTRNRNLGIGFGILLLLTLSVAMLTVTSRRAQRLVRQQMEFVAGVSHELRTPIAVIKSAAENLSEGVVGSPDRVRRYGATIGSEARRLGDMVEHVMQYAGLEAGRDRTALTALDPAVMVDEAIAETMPIITSANVQVQRQIANDLPLIIGDAVALRSAVHNLVANAVKYGGDDRWLQVRVERTGEGRHLAIRIIVEDHGPGIPAEDLQHIFEPFFRGAEALGRQVHGNGLGLSIVKRIVTAHGGRITVVTRRGEGSAFTIQLPAADPTALKAHAVDEPGLGAHGAEAHS